MLILIIEDNPLSQKLYQDLLLPEGYQIITTNQGEVGISYVAKYNPDLIILDLAIAGMNGLAVLEKLKKIAKQTPVIVASGKIGMQNDPEIKISQQVYRFFPKPLDITALREAIREIGFLPEQNQKRSWRGKSLGNYQLLDCIGQGGSGCVYKAIYNNTTVAAKILLLSHRGAEYEEQKSRFQREAELLKTIKHPNVVEVIGTGYDYGVHYIVMEYFVGESVAQILRREHCVSVAHSLNIVYQVAKGMSAAHKLGLIHRDIKPSNILYNKHTGIAKVIDFGLVRKTDDEDQSITQTGYIIGSPSYMSPEQCMGLSLDGRSDIYNLGIMLYQMLMGELPYRKDTTMQTFLAHLQEALPWPTSGAQPITPEVRQIINKMVEKDRAQRFLSMDDLIKALESVSSELCHSV